MAAKYLGLVVVCFIYSVSSIDIFSFVNPSTCLSQNRIFISSNLSCVECSPSQIPAQNGLFCECRNGYRRSRESSCIECMSGMTVSEDGSFCTSCPSGGTFNTATRECQPCNRLSFPDDLYSTGVVERECAQCPSGMQASGDQCVPCRFSDCRCARESAGVCLDSTESTNFPYLSTTFSYYSTYFASAHYLCIEEDNATACQLLKNLCALDLYRSDSVACVDVPSVFYSEGGDQLLVQEQISDLFVTRESSQGVHGLDVVLASFSLNGSFLGFLSGSKELMLCSDPYIRSLGYWPVGVTYQHQCNVRVDELQTKAEMPVFYSPYLKVGDTLYSIPVLVEGYRSNSGGLVNAGSDRTVWQLVRLFYLAESTSTDGTAINYASFMQLVVEPRGGGLIYPPYLRVRYASTSGVTSGTVQAEFSVLYEASALPQQIALPVVVVVLILLSLAYVGFKVYGFMRRSGRNFCELPTLFFMIAECCSLVAGIVFVVLLITCLFILIFFKSQIPLIFVLPTDSQEVLYIVLVALGLLCELVNVAYIMWFQCSTDIFFIDWEKPKGHMVSMDSSKMAPEGSLKAAPVSIWRTYFVANEWNEIQSLRKGHPLILLLAVLLLLQVINLGNIAAKEPITHVFYDVTTYTPPSSRVLRFALAAIFYSLLAILMRVYIVLIHERFVEHKLKQFVDLCSISNISVLILSHLKYGYYIHGRSVHGLADTDMKEMSGFFKKEELNLVAKRGLTSDSDNQVYDVAFTDNFRKYFNTILLSAKSEGTEQGGKVDDGCDGRLKAYYNMNGFLTSFIDKAIPDIGYVEQNKTLMEKALDFEFHDPSDRSLLYSRKGTTFESVLFYGKELHLFLMDVFVFTLVDMVARDFTLAAIITFLLQWIVSILRDSLGRRNLARKTLVDKRFLI